MKIEITTKTMPERHVIYRTHFGPYPEMGKVFKELGEWAFHAGLFSNPETKSLAVYYDDPENTPPEKLRTDCCFTAPEDTKIEGDIKKMKIPGGAFVVGKATITPHEFGDAWQEVMKWIEKNSYEFDSSRLCYELYHEEPKEENGGQFVLEICEPVIEK